MSETTATVPIEEGAKARITRDVLDLASGIRRRAGWEFTVDGFYRAADNPDPTPDSIDVDFYEGSAAGGVGNVCVPADAVQLAMSADDMAARRLPTRTEIRDRLASEIVGFLGHDGAEIDETEVSGDHEIDCYGTAANGLTFGFTVLLARVWETDL